MKRFVPLFLLVVCIFTLSACGNKANPITLPEVSDITSIDVTVGKDSINYTDEIWINEIISDISSSKPTNKESVQDVPLVEDYIKIDIQLETETSTLFAYKDNEKYYVEQPYQGIYEIDSQLYGQLLGKE